VCNPGPQNDLLTELFLTAKGSTKSLAPNHNRTTRLFSLTWAQSFCSCSFFKHYLTILCMCCCLVRHFSLVWMTSFSLLLLTAIVAVLLAQTIGLVGLQRCVLILWVLRN